MGLGPILERTMHSNGTLPLPLDARCVGDSINKFGKNVTSKRN